MRACYKSEKHLTQTPGGLCFTTLGRLVRWSAYCVAQKTQQQAVHWSDTVVLPAIPCLFCRQCNACRGRFSTPDQDNPMWTWPMLVRLLVTQNIASSSTKQQPRRSILFAFNAINSRSTMVVCARRVLLSTIVISLRRCKRGQPRELRKQVWYALTTIET